MEKDEKQEEKQKMYVLLIMRFQRNYCKLNGSYSILAARKSKERRRKARKRNKKQKLKKGFGIKICLCSLILNKKRILLLLFLLLQGLCGN